MLVFQNAETFEVFNIRHFTTIFISWDCCNKSPQTVWLKTSKVYFLTVLWANPESGVSRSTPSLDILGGFLDFFSFWWFSAISVDVSFQSLPPFSHRLISVPRFSLLSLIKTFVIGFWAYLSSPR